MLGIRLGISCRERGGFSLRVDIETLFVNVLFGCEHHTIYSKTLHRTVLIMVGSWHGQRTPLEQRCSSEAYTQCNLSQQEFCCRLEMTHSCVLESGTSVLVKGSYSL